MPGVDAFRFAGGFGPPPRDARLLVHFDAQAVAGSVAERLGEAVAAERVSRRGVDVEPRSSGPDRRDRPIVRLEHRGIHFAGAGAGGPMETVRVKSTQYEA